MTQRFAAATRVPPEQTKQEIERLLRDRGATKRLVYEDDDERTIVVQCFLRERMVRFDMRLPDPADHYKNVDGHFLGSLQAQQSWEKEVRRRWRVLLLWLRAKFEMVDMAAVDEEVDKDEVFDREFLGYMVLSDNTDVSQMLRPMLDKHYSTGAPLLLPSPKDHKL